MGHLKDLNLNKEPSLIKPLIKLSLLVLVTLALAQATPAHIYKNFPPEHKAKALSVEKKTVPSAPPARTETPQPATTAAAETPPVPQTVYHGTGDAYLDWIVDHESSGNQYAVNSIGACGLFQALPCEKMGCYLSDADCQIAWGRQYAIDRYGSTYNAYLFWVNHSWW